MADKTIIRQRSLPYITQVENIFETYFNSSHKVTDFLSRIFQSQSQFNGSKPTGTFFGSGHVFNSKFISEPFTRFCFYYKLLYINYTSMIKIS